MGLIDIIIRGVEAVGKRQFLTGKKSVRWEKRKGRVAK
jgi:hypothetical protein